MRKSFKALITSTVIAICYSPVLYANVLTEKEDFLISKAGKCIASYQSMTDIIEQIVERDLEIMRLYSQVEVIDRNVGRWTNISIAEPENEDITAEITKLLKQREKNLDNIVSVLYNRNLKATRLRNLKIQLSSCDLNEIPKKLIKSACSSEQIKDTPQCKMVK